MTLCNKKTRVARGHSGYAGIFRYNPHGYSIELSPLNYRTVSKNRPFIHK